MVGSFTRYYNMTAMTAMTAMKLSGSARYSRVALLVAAAVVLCLGAFLSWPATGPGVPTARTMVGSPQLHQGTSGDGQPTDWSYFAVPTEETENIAKGPVNADLLTALVLGALFLATVGWLLANGRGQGVFCSWDEARRPSFVTARTDTPFLGVFRL